MPMSSDLEEPRNRVETRKNGCVVVDNGYMRWDEMRLIGFFSIKRKGHSFSRIGGEKRSPQTHISESCWERFTFFILFNSIFIINKWLIDLTFSESVFFFRFQHETADIDWKVNQSDVIYIILISRRRRFRRHRRLWFVLNWIFNFEKKRNFCLSIDTLNGYCDSFKKSILLSKSIKKS